MSKKIPKYDYLPKLQKEIVLCLAKHGAMTINKIGQTISGRIMISSATYKSFHTLEKKDVITKARIKPYRGREFSEFWLSSRGLAFAMRNGANPENVRRNALSLSKNDEERRAIEMYFRLHSVPKIADALDEFILLYGKMNPKEMFMRLTPVMVSLDKAETKKVLDIAAEFFDQWKETMENLTKYTDMIKKMFPKKPEKSNGA